LAKIANATLARVTGQKKETPIPTARAVADHLHGVK